MKYPRLVVIIGIFLGVLCAQPYLYAQSSYAKPRTIIPSLLWARYHREYPYVFLENEHTIRLNDDWTVDEDLHYRIRIQKETAKDLGEQEIYYNKDREEILDIQAHVETPDGEKYPATKIQDLDAYQGSPLYSDMRVKVITLPQVNVGSIIDVRIRSKVIKTLIPETFSRLEIYPAAPHLHYKTTFIFPKDKGIKFKQHEPIVSPVKEEKGNEVIYTFEYRQTGSIEQIEPYLPPYTDMFGMFSFSSIKNWNVIADWYRDLVEKNIVEDEKIASKVQKLIEGKTTRKDKARAILEFLQDELRYVSMSFGDNTVEPHPSSEIFFNRYGDCKDWSILAKQMLEIAGIKTKVCLFIDEFSGNPLAGLPSVGAFNHAIIQIEVDGEAYFADPQLKYFDFGEYPKGFNYAYIFPINDEGYKFDTIQQANEKDITTTVQVIAALNGSGSAVYSVKAELSIEISNVLRVMLESVSPERRERFFETIERQFTSGGEIIDPKIQNLDDRYGPVTLIFKVKKPDAYQVYNFMMILDETIARFFPNPFVSKERSYPVFFPYSDRTKILIVYKPPAGFEADFMPKDIHFKNDLMELSRTIEQKKGYIYARYNLSLRRGRLPVNHYLEMRSAWSDYYKELQENIILKK